MDRTVPAGAALLLGFIYETETSRTPPECYDVIYGHRQSKLAKPLTQMTIAEVQRSQKYWSSRKWAARFGSSKASSAAGAAQFMRATLRGLIAELGLRGDQPFDGDLQDRLAYHLLKRRGYEDFMADRISRAEFGKRLAQEWASFPVLAPTKGAHRSLKRGQSYYAGDGLNKALIAPETVEALLDGISWSENTPPIPTSRPQEPAKDAREDASMPEIPQRPERPSVGKSRGILTILAAAVVAWLIWAWEGVTSFLTNFLTQLFGG